MTTNVYAVMRLVPDDSGPYVKFPGETYVLDKKLYHSYSEAISVCKEERAEWFRLMNPFRYAMVHDDNSHYRDRLTERQKVILKKALYNRTEHLINFTMYWKKLKFEGPFSVGTFDLGGKPPDVNPIEVPETRKLEL